jgi:hypothetical protein
MSQKLPHNLYRDVSIRLNYETSSGTVVEDYEANELILYCNYFPGTIIILHKTSCILTEVS